VIVAAQEGQFGGGMLRGGTRAHGIVSFPGLIPVELTPLPLLPAKSGAVGALSLRR